MQIKPIMLLAASNAGRQITPWPERQRAISKGPISISTHRQRPIAADHFVFGAAIESSTLTI